MQLDITAPHALGAQTFRRMWSVLIDGEIFKQWAGGLIQRWSEDAPAGTLLALDGNRLRHCRDAQHAGQHVVVLAVFDVERGIALKQALIGPAEHEIPAAARALERLDIRGKIVLADTLHTQGAMAT